MKWVYLGFCQTSMLLTVNYFSKNVPWRMFDKALIMSVLLTTCLLEKMTTVVQRHLYWMKIDKNNKKTPEMSKLIGIKDNIKNSILTHVLEYNYIYVRSCFSAIKIWLVKKVIFFDTFSWWWSLSYRSQSIDLLFQSVDWFLYDRDLRHERVKIITSLFKHAKNQIKSSVHSWYKTDFRVLFPGPGSFI